MGNEGSIILGREKKVAGENLIDNNELFNIYDNSKTNQQDVTSLEILFITSYPPRECGIATYAHNLINALNNRFTNFFKLKFCALQHGNAKYYYPEEVTSVLNISNSNDYIKIEDKINNDDNIQVLIIQHEFDLFKGYENDFLLFLKKIAKPAIIVFHTVKRQPSEEIKNYIQNIASLSAMVIVMSKVSKIALINEYQIPEDKIEVITYGTHLIVPSNTSHLKEKYKLAGKKILTSVGLLSPGKGIETALESLPSVIKLHPEIVFLIIGKTHPEELKQNGEKYRVMLESRVKSLKLQNHVHFLNGFFNSEILKEYLLITDVCIFTFTDLDRAMSGTFAFAVSCGCPIISSSTAHAYQFLDNQSGFIFEAGNADDLTFKINELLENPALRKNFSENVTRKSLTSIWENSALSHGHILNRIAQTKLPIKFKYPPINLDFLKFMTDRVGILKSAYKGEPDIRSGYTLDDNAFALYVFCMHYKITGETSDILQIRKYLKFLYHCYQPSGTFLKHLDYERKFSPQNFKENLEDTQGKAIWALGYLVSLKGLLPAELIDIADLIFQNALPRIEKLNSGRAIAFAIKGLYYYYSVGESEDELKTIKLLADKLVQKYKENSRPDWHWFDDQFVISGSLMSGALLNTWLLTGNQDYKDIAIESFEFLSTRILKNNRIETYPKSDEVSYKYDNGIAEELPIDIAFNVVASSKFYLICKDKFYYKQMDMAYNWFLGNNRLNQMLYNPLTGSCFGGLAEDSIDQQLSAESTLSYTLARMVVEKYNFKSENHIIT